VAEHAWLRDEKRVDYTYRHRRAGARRFMKLARWRAYPALESAHAVADSSTARAEDVEDQLVIVNLSGEATRM